MRLSYLRGWILNTGKIYYEKGDIKIESEREDYALSRDEER